MNYSNAFSKENTEALDLKGLYEKYKAYLFTDYLPFLERYVYDQEYGGYFWNTSYAGQRLSSSKRTWYDARGAWVYCNLYMHLDANPTYLLRAKQTLDLLDRAKDPNQAYWPWSYSQQGSNLGERDGDIYGNLFVAEAFAAYAEATGELNYWERAKEIVLGAFANYQKADYRYQLEYSPEASFTEAEEVLGHYMIFLHLCTAMLRYKEDLDLQELKECCVKALVDNHIYPEQGLMPEIRTKSGQPLPEGISQFICLGHAIEALWMLMDEAQRTGDVELFQLAALRFKHHLEVAWDRVYGGVFHFLDHLDACKFFTDKVLWAQQEAMIGCLILIEAWDDQWAKDWFAKLALYVNTHFIRHDLPYKPWKLNGDRKMNQLTEGFRIENYHHPRFLAFSLLSMDRILNKQIKTI